MRCLFLKRFYQWLKGNPSGKEICVVGAIVIGLLAYNFVKLQMVIQSIKALE